MDLLAGYGSDDEPVVAAPAANVEHLQPKMVAAPPTSAPTVYGAASAQPFNNLLAIYDPKNKGAFKYNPTKAELMAPVSGPEHPHHRAAFMPHLGNAAHANGAIAPTNVAAWAFEEQFHTYNAYGYAIGTSGEVVGDAKKFHAAGGDSVSTLKPAKRPRPGAQGEAAAVDEDVHSDGSTDDSDEGGPSPPPAAAAAASAASSASAGAGAGGKGAKKKKASAMDGSVMRAARAEAAREFSLGMDPDAGGCWAEHRSEEAELLATLESENDARRAVKAAAAAKRQEEFDVDHDLDRRDERKVSHLLPARHTMDTKPMDASSTFHGAKGTETDYQGRSWAEPPKGLRGLSAEDPERVHDAFVPKKLIHRFTGHTKGVQAIRWFPDTGHLLLSGSYDGKVKIWDAHGSRSVKRTYVGHEAGVRDVSFSHDGRHFLTAAFDRYMRYWDTETGQCVQTLTNRKVPYQARFHPEEHDVFMMAASDNRLWQWDLKSGETVQEYNHHLQAVSSVLFTDDGKRFVSTSDDKKMLIWEYGIPVPMKYISDPTMHAIPTTGLHPQGQFFSAQSMDNEIHVYGARDRFRRIRKKVFKGHTNAGFACQMTYSPNGRFMASGDGEGRLFVWDWKSTKQIRRFRAHDDGPCIDAQWHPLEPSWVATAGWDGVIKLWD